MRTLSFSVCFLLSVGLSLVGLAAAGSQDDPVAGNAVHKKMCFRCHGEEGKGDGPASKLLKVKPADWTDAARMSQYSNEELFQLIKLGGKAAGKSKLMPAFNSKLEDHQITDVVAFIQSLLPK